MVTQTHRKPLNVPYLSCLLFPNPLSCLTWARTQGCNETASTRTWLHTSNACTHTYASEVTSQRHTKTLLSQLHTNEHYQPHLLRLQSPRQPQHKITITGATTQEGGGEWLPLSSLLGTALALLPKSLNAFTPPRYLGKSSTHNPSSTTSLS